MSRAAMADAVDIPTQWKIKELKEVVDINPESRDPTQTPLEKFFYIDIDAVENGSGVISTVKELIGKDAPSRARRVVNTDDVIMSEVRPYLKAFALVPKKLNNQICSTGFAVLRSKGEIDPQYLLNALFSNDVIGQCNRMMVGAQYPALNDSQVKKIRIPLPPIPEQRSIATILTTIDDAIQRSRHTAAETEHLKAGLMQELMTKGIGHTEFRKDEEVGQVPKEWETTFIGEVIVDAQTGFASGQRDESGILQLRMNNITTEGHVLLDSFLKVPVPQDIDKYLLKSGDILFNNTNSVDLIGKTSLFQNECKNCTFSNHITRIRIDENKLVPEWLFYNFIKLWHSGHFSRICSRHVGQAGIRNDQILKILISLPSLPEQKKIVTILSSIDCRLSFQRQRTAHYEQLKQGLLNELLTGKRRMKVT